MRKTLPALLLIFSSLLCSAQKHKREFEFILPAGKVKNSLYNSLKLLDGRADQNYMGVIQTGALNRQTLVVPKLPVETQLNRIMSALTDSSSEKGELLFHLRQFSFAEITGAFQERGYCTVRAGVYAQDGDQYRQLSTIDTILVVKGADVTQTMLKSGSKIVTDLIASSLIKTDGTRTFSRDELLHIEALEKAELPVFRADTLTDGYYATYQSFSRQKPDKLVYVDRKKNGRIDIVKTTNENDYLVPLNGKNCFAFVHEGKAYVSTVYGYYPLLRENGDLHFIGRSKVTADAGTVMTAGFFFGVVGALIAADASSTMDIKIDHLNGAFVPVSEYPYLKVKPLTF